MKTVNIKIAPMTVTGVTLKERAQYIMSKQQLWEQRWQKIARWTCVGLLALFIANCCIKF